MTDKEKIILIGGGGHCKACIDVIEETGKFEILGIIDLPEKIGQKVLGYPIIDSDDNLEKIVTKKLNFLITVGFIKSPVLRIKLFGKISNLGGNFPIIISPKAYVSKHVMIDKGTIIMHGAVVNADCGIGKNVIINNHALVEHDAFIGDHTHVSTGARINGNVIVKNSCFIGSGVIVNQGITIEQNTIIASGSLVRKDILEPDCIFAGNPIKKIK